MDALPKTNSRSLMPSANLLVLEEDSDGGSPVKQVRFHNRIAFFEKTPTETLLESVPEKAVRVMKDVIADDLKSCLSSPQSLLAAPVLEPAPVPQELPKSDQAPSPSRTKRMSPEGASEDASPASPARLTRMGSKTEQSKEPLILRKASKLDTTESGSPQRKFTKAELAEPGSPQRKFTKAELAEAGGKVTRRKTNTSELRERTAAVKVIQCCSLFWGLESSA